MTIQAFIGGAGCGKTHRLMETLEARMASTPLGQDQKVLALTFMHGSRHRLEERLSKMGVLNRRFRAATIDSFAWAVIRRWQVLAAAQGLEVPDVLDHDSICEVAAMLFQHDSVVSWVHATYPVLLLDEAQDLGPSRLSIIQGLATQLEVLVAADEFQCLDEHLRPNPACDWLAGHAQTEEMTTPRRTSVSALLTAAAAVRAGTPPTSGTLFKVQSTPTSALAGSWLSNAIGWHGRGSRTAILTPTIGPFTDGVVNWVTTRTTSSGNGPFRISVDRSTKHACANLKSQLVLSDECSSQEIRTAIERCGDVRITLDMERWLSLQRRTKGRVTFERVEIHRVIDQSFSNRKRLGWSAGNQTRLMTIHGAKNREFDNVVLLWPAAMGGTVEQKQRLLYNAITRAKQRCLVLVQASAAIGQLPFA